MAKYMRVGTTVSTAVRRIWLPAYHGGMSCDRPTRVSACHWPFKRLIISYLTTGPTYVGWELAEDFSDPEPHVFQLQTGRTGTPDADDWEDVGPPVIGAGYLLDGDQRVWGKTRWTHYRVELTTPSGVYLSPPADGFGTLSRRDWRIARDILRQERLRFEQGAGIEGYLLKRRLYGTPCHCLSPDTEEVTDALCETCLGTGFEGGYYAPYGIVWAELSPHGHHTDLDLSGRGTIDDAVVTRARMLAAPQLFEQDVWVDRRNDNRWYVDGIQHLAEVRGTPIVVSAVLRLAAYSDPIYGIEIPGQLPLP